MIYVLLVVLSVAAFAALAVSMKRHQRDLVGRTLTPREARLARLGGWALIAAILLIDVARFGWGYGLVAWAGQLTMGAWIAVAGLCWRTSPSRRG